MNEGKKKKRIKKQKKKKDYGDGVYPLLLISNLILKFNKSL